MKAKHYYLFSDEITDKMSGTSLNEENWDYLRKADNKSVFSLEEDIENYERNCEGRDSYIETASIISEYLNTKEDFSGKIVSLGVGKGILEYHIKKILPNVYIECTDYTKDAIEKLKKVFIKADKCSVFDMLNGDYAGFCKESIIIMHRVSTEFNRKQWNAIFFKLFKAGIKNIIFIPTEIASLKIMVQEKKNYLKNRIKRRRQIFCGWLYSESEFISFFKGKGTKALYLIDKKVDNSDTAVYFLKIND